MRRKIFTLLLILATLPAITIKADEKQKFQLSRQIAIMNAIIKDLNLFYVDSIMPETLINKSIDAMLMHGWKAFARLLHLANAMYAILWHP